MVNTTGTNGNIRHRKMSVKQKTFSSENVLKSSRKSENILKSSRKSDNRSTIKGFLRLRSNVNINQSGNGKKMARFSVNRNSKIVVPSNSRIRIRKV